MPDEVRVSGSNGGSDRLEVSVKDRAVRIASQQLPFLLVIAVLAGFGYFMAHNVSNGQQQGFLGLTEIIKQNNTHQQALMEKLNTNQAVLLELVHVNRQQMMTELSKQNDQVNQQTIALHKAVDEQTKALRKMLVSINYNLKRDPSAQIPLEITPEELRSLEQHR